MSERPVITTNSIKDGDIRKDGLEQVIAQGGTINFALRGIKWPGQANLVVSLVSIHNGAWQGLRVLDNTEVPVISAYFEDSVDLGEPQTLPENSNHVFQGSIFLGDGFLLTHEEAAQFNQSNSRNQEVIFPVINGQEINNHPEQEPGRKIINFFDWSLDKAATYKEPYQRIEKLIKPLRLEYDESKNAWNRQVKQFWWLFGSLRIELYEQIAPISRCFVAAATTKYLNFSAAPTNRVFLNTLYVFTTDRWDLYAVVQSTLHEVWARKYSGALKQDLRYSPSKCFDTFPFPADLWQTPNPALATIGEQYHEHRRALMSQLWLGLTPIYNLFHSPDLTPALVAKVSKQPEDVAEAGYHGLLELRRLHVALDHAIRDAYGWQDLDLGHNFYEIETLAENDRVRYTISPEARKEVLRRLLALNHQRAAEEKTAAKTVFSQGKPQQSKKSAGTETAGPLKLQPPPVSKAKSSTSPKKLNLSKAQPILITDFTPPQGGFSQRLKRVNAIGQPQNQMELTELIAALGDENSQIRWLAGASLVKVGELATVHLLGAYLRTNPGDVGREEARKVLGLIGEMSEDEGVRDSVKRLM